LSFSLVCGIYQHVEKIYIVIFIQLFTSGFWLWGHPQKILLISELYNYLITYLFFSNTGFIFCLFILDWILFYLLDFGFYFIYLGLELRVLHLATLSSPPVLFFLSFLNIGFIYILFSLFWYCAVS
jgi:hypothetical protein